MVAHMGERTEGAPSAPHRRSPYCGPGAQAGRLLRHLAPHALLTSLLVLYALGGALAFSLLERPAELAAHRNASEVAQRTLHDLVTSIIDTVRANACFTGELWDNSSRSDLEEMLRAHLQQAGFGTTPPDQGKWNFMGALFFCCTIFTTIGYGNISPATSVGKVLCMAYATLGIPIMLLVVADAGDLLAAGLTRLYASCRQRCSLALEHCRDWKDGRSADTGAPPGWRRRRASKLRSRCGSDGPCGTDGPAGAPAAENGSAEADGLLRPDKPGNGAAPEPSCAPEPHPVWRSASRRSSEFVRPELHTLKRLMSLRGSLVVGDEASLIAGQARVLRQRSPSQAVVMAGGRSVVVELEEFIATRAAPSEFDGTSALRTGVGKRRLSEGGGVRPVAGARLERSRSWPGVTGVADAATRIRWIGELAEQLDVPVRLILATLVAYLALGSLMMPFWENWDYLDAFYFCFVTMTTIGLGDIVPSHPNYFMLISIYIVFGMAVMSAAFKLTQDRIFACYRRLATSRHHLCRRCLACGGGPSAVDEE